MTSPGEEAILKQIDIKVLEIKEKFCQIIMVKGRKSFFFLNLGNEIPKPINYKLQAVKKKQSGHDEFIIVNWHRGNWGHVELK